MDFRKVAFPAGLAAVLVGAALVTGIGRASPSSFKLVMENGFHPAPRPRRHRTRVLTEWEVSVQFLRPQFQWSPTQLLQQVSDDRRWRT